MSYIDVGDKTLLETKYVGVQLLIRLEEVDSGGHVTHTDANSLLIQLDFSSK